jgi:ABC-2 type transport system ATP-binding protein
MGAEIVIQTENLTKVYKRLFKAGKKALDNLTISVPKGAVYGFLGPNGAGKTTTIKILMDLIKSTGGTAYVLGKPSYDVEIKERIGFLPDSPAFSPQLTAYEFLNICGKLLKIPSAERGPRIEMVLETVKMAPHMREKIGSFSRGMLQRIGVAQAILNQPDLLILDEPLLGLDPYGRQEFKQIILTQQARGASVFFSSHILSDVEEICDHVAILNKGKLLCAGRLNKLLGASGFTAIIPPNNDEVLKELITMAAKTSRKEDGAWILTFPADDEIRGKVDAVVSKSSDKINVTAAYEKLEDFFFRTLKEDNKQ